MNTPQGDGKTATSSGSAEARDHRPAELAPAVDLRVDGGPPILVSGEACPGIEGYFTAYHVGHQWICTDADCPVHRVGGRSDG